MPRICPANYCLSSLPYFIFVLIAQLCLFLWPMDCSQPGFSVHGVVQQEILQWVDIPFSRGSSRPWDRTWVFHFAVIFFIILAIREAHFFSHSIYSPAFYLLFSSPSVVSDTLLLNGLHQVRLPCPSPSPGACTNSCPLSQWCHPPSHSLFSPFPLPLILPGIEVFPNESALHIRWPKYWSFSFSISTSNEYSGLISFRIDWFALLAVQGTLKNLL